MGTFREKLAQFRVEAADPDETVTAVYGRREGLRITLDEDIAAFHDEERLELTLEQVLMTAVAGYTEQLEESSASRNNLRRRPSPCATL